MVKTTDGINDNAQTSVIARSVISLVRLGEPKAHQWPQLHASDE